MELKDLENVKRPSSRKQKRPKVYGEKRECAGECGTLLNRYHKGDLCSLCEPVKFKRKRTYKERKK